MGKASPWSILVSLINTPKLTFRMCSFLTLRKDFSWLPGSREQAVVSDYLEAARHKLRCFGKVGRGGGDRETDSSSFCGLGKRVLGDIFLSLKGRIQV